MAGSIRKLNDGEFRITELVRRTELLDSSYRNYVNNREQAHLIKRWNRIKSRT